MFYGMIARSAVNFKPETDIPDLAGKVVLVTGGNVGLGKESILQLSKHAPKTIYLAARSEAKALSAITSLKAAVPTANIQYIHCDLTDLSSVAATAKEFAIKEERLDILLLNAGIMMVPPGTTKEGYEIQFGTNHVGHALLTKLLLPVMLRTAEVQGSDVRVVAVSSIGHVFAPSKGLPFEELKSDMSSTQKTTKYGISKLSNILFISELARRYPSITAVAVHPGVVDTDLYKSVFSGILSPVDKIKGLFYTSVVDGAKNQLWAATGKKGMGKGEVKSGEYYTPVGVTGQGSVLAVNKELAGKLWEWTEKELDGYKV